MIDESLLELLVCPICKSGLYYSKDPESLICKIDRLSFPIQDDIPVMLVSDAKRLTLEQIEEIFG